MYLYRFEHLEGNVNFGREIVNCDSRGIYECPHVIFKNNKYFTKNRDWVYILEDTTTNKFAVFCENCFKKLVSVVEL